MIKMPKIDNFINFLVDLYISKQELKLYRKLCKLYENDLYNKDMLIKKLSTRIHNQRAALRKDWQIQNERNTCMYLDCHFKLHELSVKYYLKYTNFVNIATKFITLEDKGGCWECGKPMNDDDYQDFKKDVHKLLGNEVREK